MRLKHAELVVILGTLTAFSPMSIDMYLPALPTLERVFAASSVQVQLTLATFFLGFALGQALFGPITDRYGRKLPLYVGLVIYITASVGCALAPSIHVLAVLRFMQALGACAGVVIARTIVRDMFDPLESVRVYFALMLVMGVAPILAPLIGGYVLAWAGWRAIFATLAAFGVACLAAAIFRLAETHQRPDAYPLELGRALTDYARLLAHRHYLGCALTVGFSMAAMFAYIAGSPFVFIELYDVPTQQYGWLFGLNAIGLIVASQVNGRFLYRRYGASRILGTAKALQATAGVVLFVLAVSDIGGFLGILVPLFVYIACIGCIMPNSTALAMAPYGKNAGAASALLGTLQFSLAAISALGVGAMRNGTAVPMAGVIAACGILGFASYRFLVDKPLVTGTAR